MQYFSSAEAGGSVEACYQLGVMFYDGLGTPHDPVSAYLDLYTTYYLYIEKGFPVHVESSKVRQPYLCWCTVQYWKIILSGEIANYIIIIHIQILVCTIHTMFIPSV